MNKYLTDKKERPMEKPATNNNVVQLRNDLSETDIINAEKAIELAKQIRIDLAEDITELAMENFMGLLIPYGILVDNNRVDNRDFIMIEQAIQAALYRFYGMEHPLHEVSEEVFSYSEE